MPLIASLSYKCTYTHTILYCITVTNCMSSWTESEQKEDGGSIRAEVDHKKN